MLLDAAGEDRAIEIADPRAPGGIQKRTWHVPSRAECMRCHNPWSGSALAFQLPQLNKDHDYGGSRASQLETFFQIGLCEPSIPPDKRPKLSNPNDNSADLNSRARAYLHTNCAHCHRTHAGSSVLSQMQFDLPLEKTKMLGMRPTQGTFGIHGAQVVAPGDPFRSILLYRMSKLGGGRMPHIGSQIVDPDGSALIQQWIQDLPREPDEDSSGTETAAKLRAEEYRLLGQLKNGAGTPSPEQPAIVDQLLSTTSGAL